jgi:CheY-like chemotaxis protein
MVGDIAHTFNNILGGILGYSQLQRELMAEGHPALRHAEIIEKAAKRASKLVSQMQHLTIPQPQQRKPINPENLLADISEILVATFNEKIKTEIEINHSSLRIVGNVPNLSFALLNICHNARQARSKSVRITTEAWEAKSDGSMKLIITIRDDGCGIKKADLPRVFEPYFSTRDLPGMGLTIAREIISAHGGDIHIDSKENEGTTVVISLPAHQAAGKSNHVNSANAVKGAKPEGRTILVVDDNDDLRDMTKILLERRGFRVVAAEDWKKARSLFDSNLDGIDLVILDLLMPGGSVKDFYEHIKQSNSGSKVILTSGATQDAPLQEVIDSGSEVFLPKPWDVSQLLDETYRVLGTD